MCELLEESEDILNMQSLAWDIASIIPRLEDLEESMNICGLVNGADDTRCLRGQLGFFRDTIEHILLAESLDGHDSTTGARLRDITGVVPVT